tara:strand:- start:1198 stop:1596 length:399 start_codon:yes stop_codon:yes gene_type:complete
MPKHVCNIFSKTSVAIIIILLLIIFGLSMHIYTLTGIRLIPASQAKRLIEAGDISQIVDIRTKAEYDLGHYPNSIHIPVDKINKDTVKVLDKSKTVLVYCNTGQRARYAANKLDKLGFKEVVYIDGTYNTIM